jgi:hypothetical protein
MPALRCRCKLLLRGSIFEYMLTGAAAVSGAIMRRDIYEFNDAAVGR